MDDDVYRRVKVWLSNTGFPLEMRVTRALRHGLNTNEWGLQTHLTYDDEKAGEIREVDINLYNNWTGDVDRHGIEVFVNLYIECKATNDPWILLHDSFPDEATARPLLRFYGTRNEAVLNQQSYGQLIPFRERLDTYLKGRLPNRAYPGYQIIEAFKAKNGRDAAHAATLQVCSSVAQSAKRARSAQPDDCLVMYFYIPIIVTSSPLFEVALDSTGELAMRSVDRGSVAVKPWANFEAEVYVIHESAVGTLLDDLGPFQEELGKFLSVFDRRILAEQENAPFSSEWPL